VSPAIPISTPPVVLSAELPQGLAFSPTTRSTGGIPFDLRKLTNTWRVPLEIKEIRWTTSFSFPQTGQSFRALNGGLLIAAQLASDQDIITRDFVHLAMMGRAYGAQNSFNADFVASSYDAETEGNPFGGELNDAIVNHYRWVFPRPMILRPGGGVRATVRYSPPEVFFSTDFPTVGPAGMGGAAVGIALIGRFLGNVPLPKTRTVPYCTEFLAQNPELGIAFTQRRLISLAEEFNNPFTSPLHVQRMLARIGLNTSVGVKDITTNGLFTNGPFGPGPPTPGLTMTTAGGYEAFPAAAALPGTAGVGALVPIDEVFGPQSRMWEMGHTLPDRLSMIKLAIAPFANHSTIEGSNFPAGYFSMIGHREERL
jgi:hypothetical protein